MLHLDHMTNTSNNLAYSEFSDPRLVALYDTLNPFAEDTQFYIDLAEKLSARTIIDIGCGTGLLTSELARCGHTMIGVDPEHAMLEVGRSRPSGDKVHWVEGDATGLGDIQVDLALMTGHTAQVFISDKSWTDAIKAIQQCLKPGGYLAFESRNPEVKPWAKWTPESSRRAVLHPDLGEVTVWCKTIGMQGQTVKYEMHYLFSRTDEELISINKLKFRTQEELKQSLTDIGFEVPSIFGDWNDDPVNSKSKELIFVAKQK
jgi:SAM-dependent methyltransferase